MINEFQNSIIYILSPFLLWRKIRIIIRNKKTYGCYFFFGMKINKSRFTNVYVFDDKKEEGNYAIKEYSEELSKLISSKMKNPNELLLFNSNYSIKVFDVDVNNKGIIFQQLEKMPYGNLRKEIEVRNKVPVERVYIIFIFFFSLFIFVLYIH